MRNTVSTRFWSSAPGPTPGFELTEELFTENVALGRAPAISCCASAEAMARLVACSSRLLATNRASASASVSARALSAEKTSARVKKKKTDPDKRIASSPSPCSQGRDDTEE